jgi:hypothetical protein
VPARPPVGPGEIADGHWMRAMSTGRKAAAAGWRVEPVYAVYADGTEMSALRLARGAERAVATWERVADWRERLAAYAGRKAAYPELKAAYEASWHPPLKLFPVLPSAPSEWTSASVWHWRPGEPDTLRCVGIKLLHKIITT